MAVGTPTRTIMDATRNAHATLSGQADNHNNSYPVHTRDNDEEGGNGHGGGGEPTTAAGSPPTGEGGGT